MRENLIKQKEEIDESTIIDELIAYPLSEMDRYSRKKVSQDIAELNNTIHQLDVIDVYRLLQPTTGEHAFLSNSH